MNKLVSAPTVSWQGLNFQQEGPVPWQWNACHYVARFADSDRNPFPVRLSTSVMQM